MARWTVNSAIVLAAAFAIAGFVPSTAAHDALVEQVFATQSGEPAFDNDSYGGNPFASAFIEALASDVSDAAGLLLDRTMDHSGNEQVPDIDALSENSTLVPLAGEIATALVVVFADYGSEDGLRSLPGAAFDAARVGAALNRSNYTTRIVVAQDAAEYRRELALFSETSSKADRALVYTTGHGSEAFGQIYLIPPEADGTENMMSMAIKMSEISPMLRARSSNRLFYAGCRDNPFGF